VTDIKSDLVKGIVYSQFHTKLGPVAVAWIPHNLSIEMRDLVSLKSINILTGEKGSVPETVAIIPFPSFNLKGMVKCIEIKDEKYRGGAKDSAITILFDEINDLIYYKYMDNFKKIFNELTARILELEENGASKQTIEEELEKFYGILIDTLNDLCAAELSCTEGEEFPIDIGKPKQALREYRYKIIVVGDSAVGKTSLILRFTDRAFRRTYLPTLGVNISEKQITINGAVIQFIIWDIAGQAKFKKMRKHFYAGADGQLLVFDLTRKETFKNIVKWFEDIRSFHGDLIGLILGNKNDLIDLREVEDAEGLKLANELQLEYIETSALTGENVDKVFNKLGELLMKIRKKRIKK